jgi:hypothetical protein
MWEILCRDRDLQAINAEINNVIYIELYSGPKMVHGKYGKTNVAESIDQDSTVYGPTFGNAESCLFLFAAQCFNTESMQKVILCHSCV